MMNLGGFGSYVTQQPEEDYLIQLVNSRNPVPNVAPTRKRARQSAMAPANLGLDIQAHPSRIGGGDLTKCLNCRKVLPCDVLVICHPCHRATHTSSQTTNNELRFTVENLQDERDYLRRMLLRERKRSSKYLAELQSFGHHASELPTSAVTPAHERPKATKPLVAVGRTKYTCESCTFETMVGEELLKHEYSAHNKAEQPSAHQVIVATSSPDKKSVKRSGKTKAGGFKTNMTQEEALQSVTRNPSTSLFECPLCQRGQHLETDMHRHVLRHYGVCRVGQEKGAKRGKVE